MSRLTALNVEGSPKFEPEHSEQLYVHSPRPK